MWIKLNSEECSFKKVGRVSASHPFISTTLFGNLGITPPVENFPFVNDVPGKFSLRPWKLSNP